MFNMPELALAVVLVLRYDNVQHAKSSFSSGASVEIINDNVQHARSSFSSGASVEI